MKPPPAPISVPNAPTAKPIRASSAAVSVEKRTGGDASESARQNPRAAARTRPTPGSQSAFGSVWVRPTACRVEVDLADETMRYSARILFAHQMSAAMHARVTTLRGAPGDVHAGIENFRENVVPFAREQGKGALLLVDRQSG